MPITTMATVKLLGRMYDRSGAVSPTTSTAGELLDIYLDTVTGLSYTLTSIATGPPIAYTWPPDTSRDAEISLYITKAEADYIKIRGIFFDTDESDDPVYPDGSEITAAEMVLYCMGERFDGRGKASEALSSRNATYDAKLHGYPLAIVGGIARYHSAL
jgi:hypothetical protein